MNGTDPIEYLEATGEWDPEVERERIRRWWDRRYRYPTAAERRLDADWRSYYMEPGPQVKRYRAGRERLWRLTGRRPPVVD